MSASMTTIAEAAVLNAGQSQSELQSHHITTSSSAYDAKYENDANHFITLQIINEISKEFYDFSDVEKKQFILRVLSV